MRSPIASNSWVLILFTLCVVHDLIFQRKLSRRRLPITFVHLVSHASAQALRPITFSQRFRTARHLFKLMSRRRVSSDHPGMKNIPGEVSIFCLWTNWIHLKEYIFKLWQDRIPWAILFALSIAVHTGGLAKNRFWLVATEKKRIGEQPNYFWNMCPKSFAWAKNKRKLVLTESQEDRFYRERHLCVLTSAILYLYVKRTMLFDVRSVNSMRCSARQLIDSSEELLHLNCLWFNWTSRVE